MKHSNDSRSEDTRMRALCVVLGPLSNPATAIEILAIADKLTNEQHCDCIAPWLQYPSIGERRRRADPESNKLSFFREELKTYHGRSVPVLIGVTNDIPDMFPDAIVPEPDESLLMCFIRLIGEEPVLFHQVIAQNVHGIPAMLAIASRDIRLVSRVRETFREILGVGPICEGNAQATIDHLSDQSLESGYLAIAYAGDRWEPVIDRLQLRGIDESANIVIHAAPHHKTWVFAHEITLMMITERLGGRIEFMGPGYPAGSHYLELDSRVEARSVTDLLQTADHVRRTQ